MQGFLPLESWIPYLRQHPDQRLAAFLHRGITFGFRIGVDKSVPLEPPPDNLPSAAANPQAVTSLLQTDIEMGRLIAIEQPAAATDEVRCNPIGVIPKSHQPGKFRLIVNLSAPPGASVNDAISANLSTLHYIKVSQAAALIAKCGPGALIAKLDLHSAYRRVPVHPEDQHLLGLRWEGTVYIDRALPFGLRSAPKIFTAVADGLAWALSCEGVRNQLHYLDDFLFWSAAGSSECAEFLATAIRVCHTLGLPSAPEKTAGPTTTLTFLGIEIDTVQQQLRLPAEKLQRLRQILALWASKKWPTKLELQSLLGHLSHAASVVRPGRIFTRNITEDMKRPRDPLQRTRLTAGARADLAWWRLFVSDWNGVDFFPGANPHLPSPTVTSDASGSWGCGAFLQGNWQWFQIQWPRSWEPLNIAVKELLPIVASAAVWGTNWAGRSVIFHCDNMAVVYALNARSAHDPNLSHLLGILFFFEAHFRFEHRACHIAGRDNLAADALSRNDADSFFSLLPQAPRTPTRIPPTLWELLFNLSLRWTSQSWGNLFSTSLREVSRNVQQVPTPPPKGAS